MQCVERSERPPDAADLPGRLRNIMDFLTATTYEQICRGLFERHKLLFSFLVCVRVRCGRGPTRSRGGEAERVAERREWWAAGTLYPSTTPRGLVSHTKCHASATRVPHRARRPARCLALPRQIMQHAGAILAPQWLLLLRGAGLSVNPLPNAMPDVISDPGWNLLGAAEAALPQFKGVRAPPRA